MHVFRGIAKTEKIIQPLQPCVFPWRKQKIFIQLFIGKSSFKNSFTTPSSSTKTRVIESWLNTKTTSKLACCCSSISILNAPPPVLFGCFLSYWQNWFALASYKCISAEKCKKYATPMIQTIDLLNWEICSTSLDSERGT